MATEVTQPAVAVGSRYQVKPGRRLFINDKCQFGIWIEPELSVGTKGDGGEEASGELDSRYPICIAGSANSDYVVCAVQLDGANRGTHTGITITPAVLQEHFELVTD